MLQPLNLQWILWILLALLLALVGYFILYPLNVIALFSHLIKKKRKSKDDVLAVPVKFRIRIWFDQNATDKSSLIAEIKKQLNKLAEKHSDVGISHSNESDSLPDLKENIATSFIPGDDQPSLNPDIQIGDGPDIREEDVQDENEHNPAGYIRLKDL